jgi:glycosyltransferase involved in cell wall biosynthesis
MRILISVQNYHPAYSFGGRVINAVALAEGLHGLGHDVEVVTSTVIERDGIPSRHTYRDCINGVNVTYLGTWLRIKGVSLNPSVLPFALSDIGRFDAVYIIGLYDILGAAVAFAARRAGVPYVVEPSGMLIPIVQSLRLKRAYHFIFGRPMLNGARAVVVTSQIEWDDALRFGIPREKLFLSRNGINLEEYKSLPHRGVFRRRLGISDDVSLILWLGRIEAKKNLEQLIEALAGLKHCSWALAIVGPSESPDYLNSLKWLASELGIEDRLWFVPGLYNGDKLAAYGDADIFVLVSVNENWGHAAIEAIASGVPVLVTRTCGVAGFVEGRAGLVVDRSVTDIRAGLERLMADSDLYRRFKLQLPDLVSELSWDKPVRERANLFQSC